MAITITIGNQKGGTGKSSTSCMLGYILAKKGYKTLLVDLDPQANSTKTLWLTNNTEQKISRTLMYGLTEGDLFNIPINIVKNLDLLPSHKDLEYLPQFLYEKFTIAKERDTYLARLLTPIKNLYDIIIIDTPPMALNFTINALCASDYVIIALQTQERSYNGANNYIEQISDVQNLYDLDLKILGIVRVLVDNKGKIDSMIGNEVVEVFGDYVFNTIIPCMQRVKRYDITGITNTDYHDNKCQEKYDLLANEIVERIKEYEQNR